MSDADLTEEAGFEDQGAEDPAEFDDTYAYADEESDKGKLLSFLPIALLTTAMLGWTGFFLFANQDRWLGGIETNAIAGMITDWSVPAAFLILCYLLYMRNSRREGARFGAIAESLRDESALLERRMMQVNADIVASRDNLSQQSALLEELGQRASEKLASRAEEIQRSLTIGLEKVERLDVVGGAATRNLEQLREHLPTVIASSKDVANQIGNIGRTAQNEVTSLISGLQEMIETGRLSTQGLKKLTEESDLFRQKLNSDNEELQTRLEALFGKIAAQSDQVGATINQRTDDSLVKLEAARTRITAEMESGLGSLSTRTDAIIDDIVKRNADVSEELDARCREIEERVAVMQASLASGNRDTIEQLDTSIEQLRTQLASLSELRSAEEERLQESAERLANEFEDVQERLEILTGKQRQSADDLQESLNALDLRGREIGENLGSGFSHGERLAAKMTELNDILFESGKLISNEIPAVMDKLTDRTIDNNDRLGQLTSKAERLQELGTAISSHFDAVETSSEKQVERTVELEQMANALAKQANDHLQQLQGEMDKVRAENDALAQGAGEKLVNALLRIRETASQAAGHARESFDESLTESADRFEKTTRERVESIVRQELAGLGAELEEKIARAVAGADSKTSQLRSEISELERLAESVEGRVRTAQENAQASNEDNFTRQVALITDSLNSTAIDVTKLLSSDVSDVEWAAYLKGDRGIFTRRAVRLLNAGEARDILSEYEENGLFQEHVNRYIHDFEAMLRFVLGTRDGNPVAVTLLSSDIGKLYVALAQAIERLRV